MLGMYWVPGTSCWWAGVQQLTRCMRGRANRTANAAPAWLLAGSDAQGACHAMYVLPPAWLHNAA